MGNVRCYSFRVFQKWAPPVSVNFHRNLHVYEVRWPDFVPELARIFRFQAFLNYPWHVALALNKTPERYSPFKAHLKPNFRCSTIGTKLTGSTACRQNSCFPTKILSFCIEVSVQMFHFRPSAISNDKFLFGEFERTI